MIDAKSYRIDFKHPDMVRALDAISTRITDVQRLRDHYKRMSGTQLVSLPDRFGNKVFHARELALVYEDQHDALQKVYQECYDFFKVETSSRAKIVEEVRAAVSGQVSQPAPPHESSPPPHGVTRDSK